MNSKTLFVLFVILDYIESQDPSKILEVERFYSLHRTPGRTPKGSYISNFNRNLNMFSGCLIHAFNFEGIDLPLVHHTRPPILLTRVDVVQVYFGRKRLMTFDIQFEKTPIGIRNDSNLMSLIDWRKLRFSPYASLMRKSRPWKCEVHVYILPPKLQEDIFSTRATSVASSIGNPPIPINLSNFFFRTFSTPDLILRQTIFPTLLFPRGDRVGSNVIYQYGAAAFNTQW